LGDQILIEDYLYEQNLHWQEKPYVAGTERELLQPLVPLFELDHIIAISGVRRCGKSFLLKQLINRLVRDKVPPQNIIFANLELPAFFGRPSAEVLDELWDAYLKLKNPQGRVYLFLDEVQTLPGWETWTKYHYDQKKGEIKFVITGSNSQLLPSEFATLLSGRVIEKKLFPFSLREMLAHRGIEFREAQQRSINKSRIKHVLEAYIQEGGMPELLGIQEREMRREVMTSYFNTIIYKDIVPRFSVRHSGLLKDLAVYLCGQTSTLVNLAKLAEVFGSNRATMKEFIQYLQLSFLLLLVDKFDFSAKKRELALKKAYLIDNGFAAFLPLRFSADRGRLLENLIYVELLRRFASVFYWRNHYECDLIAYGDSLETQVFQVCHQLDENNRARELSGLKAACDLLGKKAGIILTFDQADRFEYSGLQVQVVPVHEWLLG